MKSYEERLPLLDKAILEEGGQWKGGEYNYLFVSTHKVWWGAGILCYLPVMQSDPHIWDTHWKYVGSKEEFIQRLQELQEKPSWDSAPKWANWLAQDYEGEWSWHEDKPVEDALCNKWNSNQKVMYTNEIGEVIGDWTDTLEERPYTLGGVEVVDSSKSRSWDDLFIHFDARHTINAEHTDIIMPDGSKVRLLDILMEHMEHKAVKRFKLEQKVAQVIDDNYGRDALSVARAVLKTLEENDNEQQ